MIKVQALSAVSGLVLAIACHCTFDADNAVPRVIDKATPFVRPDNVPAASDVTMRTLAFRPVDETDPHDTFKALDAFHATRLEWVYLTFDDDEAEIGPAGVSGRQHAHADYL